jgi:hypothetical protein
MKWSITFLIVLVIAVILWCFFVVGVPTINKLPVSDEPPAFQTAEPISISRTALVPDPLLTGEPQFLYSQAEETREN